MKKALALVLSAALLTAAAACSGAPSNSGSAASPAPDAGSSAPESASAPSSGESLSKVTFVLDWTPNTNHTGLYVADSLGYFKDAGLEVDIQQPPEDGATALVASGKAQFGVDFQDSLAPAFTADLPVTAVAAVIQHNTSGIVSMKAKGIDSPKGMEGKTYATWDMPVEKATLENVVTADGGDWGKVNLVPSMVTDVVSALQSNIDAVWIYYAWDGIACKVKGLDTNYFYFKDINPVFDYYTPVIVANNDYLKNHPEEAKAFMGALKKGYEYAIQNPEEAADILCKADSTLDQEIVMESQKWLANQYQADADGWGVIDASRWDPFYQWLWDNRLIEKEIPAGFGFSNDYLS